MAWNIPDLLDGTNPHMQEEQWISNRLNKKKNKKNWHQRLKVSKADTLCLKEQQIETDLLENLMRAMNFTPREMYRHEKFKYRLERNTTLPKADHKPHLRILVLDFGPAFLMPFILSYARVITEASNLISKVPIIFQHCLSPLPPNLLVPFVLYFC